MMSFFSHLFYYQRLVCEDRQQDFRLPDGGDKNVFSKTVGVVIVPIENKL